MSTASNASFAAPIGAEISEEGLRSTIILNARSLIEKDADFAKFAGRILLSYIYEEVLDWSIMRDGIEGLKEAHRKAFKAYLRHGVAIERLSPKLLQYDLEKLAEALDPSADLDFEYLGIQTLYDRYLIVDKTRQPVRRIETPQFFWMRVAMGLFIQEEKDREEWVIRLYNLYKSRRFCSSTPTLFNSGTPHSQLSSCYLYKVDDNIESIMLRGIAENAFLSKWAGGLGGSWTAVRGTGSYIKGTNGESQGVIPFLKLHNDQLVAVNQGGKRRGSGCAYLETWHNDIEDFLKLRINTGDERRRTHDLNTANWMPDLFMKRMEAREHWTLFRSNEVPDLHDAYGRKFEERYVHYERLARGRQDLRTGDPRHRSLEGDAQGALRDRPSLAHLQGPLQSALAPGPRRSHPLVEPLHRDHPQQQRRGNRRLQSRLRHPGHAHPRRRLARFRNASRNHYRIAFARSTTSSTSTSTRPRRPDAQTCATGPIGLGVMGLQNALFKKGIGFADPEAIEFNDEFMEAVAYYAYNASSELAAERGTYSSYRGSKWDRGLLPQDTIEILEKERGIKIDVPRGGRMDWNPVRDKIKKHGMRNSNVLAIAPTATISNITGTTPCIEPNYKNLYVKSNLSGDFIVLNRELVLDLKKEGLWNEEMVDQLKYFDGELKDIESHSRSTSSANTRPSSRSATMPSSTLPPAGRNGSTSRNRSTSSWRSRT